MIEIIIFIDNLIIFTLPLISNSGSLLVAHQSWPGVEMPMAPMHSFKPHRFTATLSSEDLMKTKLFRFYFGCLLALAACAALVHGQVVTGTITGQVTDPSGAVIANANA